MLEPREGQEKILTNKKHFRQSRIHRSFIKYFDIAIL